MKISHEVLREHRASGSWLTLEQRAQLIIEYAKIHGGESFSPVLGGGTRLMLALNHRISDDIDLFIDSPGWLGYITPRLNDRVANEVTDYEEENDYVKLHYPEGEIDFIAASNLLVGEDLWNPTAPETQLSLQPPAEVLAKKLFYRGWKLTARDLFDWWALAVLAPNDAIPHGQIATLLSTRLDLIVRATNVLSNSAAARVAWSAIRSPEDHPSFEQALIWAREQAHTYETINSA